MIRAIIKFFLWLFFSIFFRVEKHGEEKLPKTGGFILAPKHLSNWDPPVIVAKTRRNDMYILAKQELFINGFVRFLAKKTKVLPVKRGERDTSLIKTCVKALKEGNIVLLFPEGTRNGIEKRGKIQNGAVIMANMANVPIIPVGVQATYKPFSKVIFNYGDPISVGEKKMDKEEIENASKDLMNELMRLTSQKF